MAEKSGSASAKPDKVVMLDSHPSENAYSKKNPTKQEIKEAQELLYAQAQATSQLMKTGLKGAMMQVVDPEFSAFPYFSLLQDAHN